MAKLNSYLGMAENDRLFAIGGVKTCDQLGVYNSVASISAQSAEKYLKAIIADAFTDDDVHEINDLLHSHNLRTLYNKIVTKYTMSTTSKDCKWLGDFYFDARYPGDNFVTVSKEDCTECLTILEQIKSDTENILNEIKKQREKEKEALKDLKAFDQQ